MNETVKRILDLMQKYGINAHKLEREASIAISSIQTWRSGKSKPSLEAVSKIADYFGVSVDYLLGKTASNIYPAESITLFEEIGTIRGGYDGMVNESPTGRKIEVPTSMLHGRPATDFFTLRVKGDSMYPRILDGDTILCERCTSVDDGAFAVVLYNGNEATVKKVHYVFGENWLELIPCNPEYKIKRIEGADLEQCRILGKVIKLIRDM